MADITEYYNKLFDAALSPSGKIRVASSFHGQMKQIDKILNDDRTATISTILDFMVGAANVDISFDSGHTGLDKLFLEWKKNVNKDISIDIPKGLRSFTEQYFRERWKSSFIVLKIRWGKMNGYTVPIRMWLMDGASIYVKNDKGNLNTNEYYLGKFKKEDLINSTESETVMIRKPSNHWYDLYPTPYLKRRGALYHGLFKNQLLERQAEFINTAFPYQFFVKMGCEAAMQKNLMPTETQLKEVQEKFQQLKGKSDTHVFAKGFGGAVPFDVNF